MDELRALLVALVAAILLLLGTPGLDWLPSVVGASPSRSKLTKEYGPTGGGAVYQLSAFNQQVRQPAAKLFRPIEKTFRIAQSWHLYRNGPGVVRRLVIKVDDNLVFRAGDPDHTWLSEVLTSRRIRPIAESTTNKDGGNNWRGLAALIVHHARADFPNVQSVRIETWWAPWPGGSEKRKKTIVAKAPDWEPRRR